MLAPVTGTGGPPTAVLCVSREVTAEHEALDSLRESQERLAVAARVGGLGIWDYHIERDELHCDETWYRIMGRDPDRPIRSIHEFRPFIHPDDVDRATEVKQTVAELVAAKRDYAIVFRIVRPSGEIRWVRSAACLLLGGTGAPVRAIGFVVDITDAWHGERALREEKERLAARERWLTDTVENLIRRVIPSAITAPPSEPGPITAGSEVVFDRAAALARAGGDEEVLRHAVRLFQDQAAGQLGQIRNGTARGDSRAVMIAAHTLLGSVGFYGAVAATEAARSLEELALRGDLDNGIAYLERLQHEVERLLAALASEFGGGAQ